MVEVRAPHRRAQRLQDERIRSTSTLNQRSTVCWMRSLPTAITSTAGATAIRMNTSIELHAEARAQHAAPALHHHPHEVAPEEEHEDEEERDVHDDEAVEQHRREEVGREVAALAQETGRPTKTARAAAVQRRTSGVLLRKGGRGPFFTPAL